MGWGKREYCSSKRPRVKRVALFPGRAGDKSAEHVASLNEQRDPQAKPAVLQYFGKTAVNNKKGITVFRRLFPFLRYGYQ